MAYRIVIFSCLIALSWGAASRKNRIVNGGYASLGDFPHQVSIQTGKRPHHFCGGAILNERWIMTAAHCVDTPKDNMIVKAGKINVNKYEITEQNSTVERTIIHELYAGKLKPYDIALLKLTKPFHFNDYVQKIDLPKAYDYFYGKVIISGWGSVSENNKPLMPSHLQTVTLYLLEPKACQLAFNSFLLPYTKAYVHQTSICTSAGKSGSTTCGGDSGSPLIFVDESGKKTVIGVASWTAYPCGGISPSVYTNVAYMVPWIEEKMSSE